MSQSLDSLSESQLFTRDKQAWENAIAIYKGNDPLELWFNYICWYDYNIHVDPDNKFQEVLEKCLSIFEHNEMYKQDMRMIKLWVKYIDLQPNPLNLYQILYQRGVGTQCSCFYIGWAHYYDSANAFKQAESVYNLGFQAKAEPYSELQDAHTKFRLSVSQRMLYNDSSSKKRSVNNLIEQRHQITALTLNALANSSMKKNKVEQSEFNDTMLYSTLNSQTQDNEQQDIYMNSNKQNDLNKNTYMISSYFHSEIKLENAKIPQNFSHYARNNFETWKPLLFIEEPFELNKVCVYQKNLIYPGGESEFSPEEIRSKKWFQQKSQSSSNHQLYTTKEKTQQNFNNDHIQKHENTCYSTQNNQNVSKNQYLYKTDESSQTITDYSNRQSEYHHELYNNFIKKDRFDQISTANENKEMHYMQKINPNSIQQSPNDFNNKSKLDYHPISHIDNNNRNYHQNIEKYTIENTSSTYNLKNSQDNKFQYDATTSPMCSNMNNYHLQDALNTTTYDGQKHQFTSENNDQLAEVRDDAYSWEKESRTKDHNKYFPHRKKEQHQNKSSQTTTTTVTVQNTNETVSSHHVNKMTTQICNENVEEQIEASTIRFSTDTNGGTKSKTITIKFRKEPNSSSYSNVNRSFESHKQHSSERKRRLNKSMNKSYNNESEDSNLERSVEERKVKRIRIVNNFNDHQINSKSDSDSNLVQNCRTKIITPLQNEYDDVNLLLSPAQTFSDDSNAPSNSSFNVSLRSNDDSISNTEFNVTNDSSYYSTPKLSQINSKAPIVTPIARNLKGLTTKFSLQSDDSVCSYEQNSFFSTETDEEFEQRRLKALNTIEMHLSKSNIDPFSSELCKAFLTKLNFPQRESNNVYKLLNTPIPKLVNTKSTVFGETTYNIEKEVGRGSYGSVYRAVDTSTSAVVAIKYQRPPNIWEVYICNEVKKRIKNFNVLPGFMNISSAIFAPNASIIITEFSSYGSLLDVNNKIRQATKKVMHESLTMHFSSQILDIVNYLHSCKIIHADIKPDNFLLMKVPSADSIIPSLRLIDFGCAIDMTLFPDNTQFKKIIQTDGFTCIEMQEGKPWSYQTDLFCTAGTIHVILFGEYMQITKRFDQWDIKQKLPRYLKKHVWNEFFAKMLNIKDINNLPNLGELKSMFDNELSRMNSELQANIRTLSNILHRR